jgi:hypothetical protein|tara:strand:- start:39 stop:527 length:489 start_codon:yes stop_codon:yes gene_type:complete
MKEYYNLIDNTYNYLIGNNNINTVTTGDILDVDLSKQSIFPLAHIIVNDVTFDEHFMTFSLNVIAMDIVDEDKKDKQTESKPYIGLDNKHDILNSMLTVINGLQSSLRRGGMNNNNYEINDSPTATQFEDRFENLLSGWSMVLNIEIPNDAMKLINADGTEC